MEQQLLLVGDDGSQVFEAQAEDTTMDELLEVARSYGKELGRVMVVSGWSVPKVVRMIHAFAEGLTAEHDLADDQLADIRETCAQVAAAYSVAKAA